MDAESKPTLTVEEVANLLGIGRRQAYEAVHSGEIPSYKIGHRILIPRARLDRMLNGSPEPAP